MQQHKTALGRVVQLLIALPEPVAQYVDRVLEKRQAEYFATKGSGYQATPAELEQARTLAKQHGSSRANQYLRECRKKALSTQRRRAPSRTSVVVELLEQLANKDSKER